MLAVELPWLQDVTRAKTRERLPVVLSRAEVRRLFAHLRERHGLMARLLFGTGMRLMEGVRLRGKDLDFERREVIVRAGKGGKDRRTMRPEALNLPLQSNLEGARQVALTDGAAGVPGVFMADALARKYPRASQSWGWFWVFPANGVARDPVAGIHRRHHTRVQALQRAIKAAVAGAGIPEPATTHPLRHAFATRLLAAGYDLRTVQELLGHKVVNTTMIDTRVLHRGARAVGSPLAGGARD